MARHTTDPRDIPNIDDAAIFDTLERQKVADAAAVRDVLDKAAEMKGLNADEVATLCTISDPELLGALFDTAKQVKDTIYGSRLVIFAPLYISNLCANECLYCAFRATNKAIKRRALQQDEIQKETEILLAQGHKRVLVVAGESYPTEGFSYVLKAVESVYAARYNNDSIRRVNVNVAPLSVEEFKALKATGIGTYQIFQETYHRGTYAKMHLKGVKKDYDWRVSALDRSMQANIDDVGIGVLFGLFDWRYEILAMMQHIAHLEARYGVGPHTVSVPRLEPACGSDIAAQPPYPVSDVDFRKIVAILRLAVPYTGIIMSTRETAAIRRESFALGVSQISAGSRTNPGGYGDDAEGDKSFDSEQFSLGDHRPLDEVIRDVASLGYVPSFCTGCYRLGRTGQDFMDLAKPGDIRHHCGPNAISTFMEYLMDYASDETKTVGLAAVDRALADMEPEVRKTATHLMEQVKSGKRDVYC